MKEHLASIYFSHGDINGCTTLQSCNDLWYYKGNVGFGSHLDSRIGTQGSISYLKILYIKRRCTLIDSTISQIKEVLQGFNKKGYYQSIGYRWAL